MLKNNIVHTRGLLGYLKKKYNGVIRINDTVSGVVTTNLTGDIDIDYSNSYGTSDKVTQCNYIILNGYLYYRNDNTLVKVNSSNIWSCVSGAGVSGYAYGINDGKLYAISGTTTTQVGNLTNWNMVSGGSVGSTYGYGIAGGKLYKLNSTTATQIGSSTKWEFVQGGSSDYSYTFGINAGKIYSIKNTTTSQIGTVTSFKEVRGEVMNGLALAITELGHLYRFTIYSLLKIDDTKEYTNIFVGYESSNGYAISEGKLFHINMNNGKITQIGDSDKWEDITGTYGINNGVVYKISGTTITRLDVQHCKGVYGGGSTPLALCEVK